MACWRWRASDGRVGALVSLVPSGGAGGAYPCEDVQEAAMTLEEARAILDEHVQAPRGRYAVQAGACSACGGRWPCPVRDEAAAVYVAGGPGPQANRIVRLLEAMRL